MGDDIEWKEAKGGTSVSVSDDDEQEIDEFGDEEEADANDEEFCQDKTDFPSDNFGSDDIPADEPHTKIDKSFSHKLINLSLRRNIVALADANLHKPKPNYSNDNQNEPFDLWLENALVAISPTADILLFAGQSPEKVTFMAKLRQDPINQYITKKLDIALDYDEQVTSLLCLPIMSTQKTAIGLVDWTVLVVGLSSGYVRFYTEQSICLLSLKYCDEPVISLKCQTQKSHSNARSETHFATIADELLIAYKTIAVIADGLGLYENLRIAKAEVVRNGLGYEPAYNLSNLPSILTCHKWITGNSRGSTVMDADMLGTRRTTTFDSFLSDSINFEHTAANPFSRTLALVGRDPFISSYRESKDYSAHSYTKMIGSIFSLWNKPPPSRIQMTEISSFNNLSLLDRNRLATNIIPSPDKRLAAVTDDFGRVLLIDVTNWLVVRMWKGYRSAQCGWIDVKRNPEQRNSPYASFLVFYAPKRGLLEIWSAQRGPRVAAFNVGKNCRLLYCGYKMLNMRSDSTPNDPVEQSYSSHCYLLNAKSENIFCVELPYTYSLYKYGDLKSRDHLLIGELTVAIQQDAQHELISEILHRIALVEYLQKSIHKIAHGLSPQKIVPVMENLINKTMKNYDNHSGEPMTDDDMSIINLCKRLIRLCVIFKDLSDSVPQELSLPDVNQRLIEQYEEHPQEMDDFSKQLGWSISEILRYLSLLTLGRSYTKNYQSNPWPNLGEPLAWPEFVSCFDLGRVVKGSKANLSNTDELSIRLKEFSCKFLSQDKIVKTALFMYNRLSEKFYILSQNESSKQSVEALSKLVSNYNYIEPPTRLALLLQFWLSSKLCNHWKMWSFLQDQVGQISDELKVIAMSQGDDRILIETWKKMYHLILESDNLFAAIIATATIKSDTLRMIQDNEKREKIERNAAGKTEGEDDESRSTIDWECLCIDAERMCLLSQQLEDVFLLNLLLRYSPCDGHLIDGYLYKVTRISVANILRGGPTIVSELVAQWAVQSGVKLKIFLQPYGQQSANDDTAENQVVLSSSQAQSSRDGKNLRSGIISLKTLHLDKEEQAKELLHHTKASYPCSLDPDVVLCNCVWEFCRQWTSSNPVATDKTQLLRKAYDCLSLISVVRLRHKLACTAYKTFFQRTFERLVILVETNSTIVNVKNTRLRDTLTRKELNMGEEHLEEFVQFFCDLSEFMLQTCSGVTATTTDGEKEALLSKETELKSRLLAHDRWWTTPTAMNIFDDSLDGGQPAWKGAIAEETSPSSPQLARHNVVSTTSYNSFLKTTLFTPNTLDVNVLVELNRLANLVNLIFKLRVVKAYPMSLIGEESRHILQIDMNQLTTRVAGSSSNHDSTLMKSLTELRQKFARKCIINVVCKMGEETSEFNEEDDDDDDDVGSTGQLDVDDNNQDIDTKQSSSKSATRSKKNVCADQARPTNQDNGNNMWSAAAASSSKRQSNIDRLTDSTEARSSRVVDYDDDYDVDGSCLKAENNESMVLFANLLSLASEWELNCDELHLEFVFELYRCNHDKIAAQISHRVLDQQTLANGLLKIASQRVLVLFGLSPYISDPAWRRRNDKWSVFQPNIVSWLKSIQQEEMRREIACLSFQNYLKPNESDSNPFNLHLFVLRALRKRTKLVLDSITNHLDGQAARLAHDLLQLLESQLLDKLMLEARDKQDR